MQIDKASEKSIRITAMDTEDQGVKVFLISVRGWPVTCPGLACLLLLLSLYPLFVTFFVLVEKWYANICGNN